jgi:hypothetical protein
MIVRMFRGRVRPGLQEEYLRLLQDEAMPMFRAHPGLEDVRIAIPLGPGDDEFVVTTVWHDLPSLRSFAGERWFEPRMTPVEAELLRARSVWHYRTAPTEPPVPPGGTGPPTEVDLGRIRVDPARRAAWVDGARIELPPREFAALVTLAARAEEPVPAPDLAFGVWPDRPWVTPEDVRRVVYRLRRFLGDGGPAGLIRTRRGHGYVLEPNGRK